MPPQSLETAYRSELGNVFKTLLKSGIQSEPLSSEDEALKQQLTQAGVGLSQPNSLNALMGAMLFYPADTMKVRDAKTRLPAWVYGDYAAVFESGAAVAAAPATVPAAASISAPTPVTQGAAQSAIDPNSIPELPPVHEQDPSSTEFTNRAIGCANLYYIDPSDKEIVLELRQIRHHLARHLAGLSPQSLESVYRTNVGDAYRALLKSEFRSKEPLSREEASISQQLGQASAGLTQPHSINALMGVLLYSPTGKLQVRDARNRLPAWLYADYAAAFEAGGVTGDLVASPVASASAPGPAPAPTSAAAATVPAGATIASLPAPMATPHMPDLAVESPQFLNRLLGSANLYAIDPDDAAICSEVRGIRRRFADYWLTLDESQLEAAYQSDLGRGYKLLLSSGFQKESLESEEEAYKQALTKVAAGLTAPKALNAMMAAMLYFPTDKLRVPQAEQRLPGWLLPDYMRVFEGKQVADPTGLDVQPPSPEFAARLSAGVNRYQNDRTDASAVAELRRLRHALAHYWMQLDPSQVAAVYGGPLGQAQRQLLGVGFSALEKTPLDRETFKELSGVLAQGMSHLHAIGYFVAAMLYCRPAQLKIDNPHEVLPSWLLTDYSRFFAGVAA